RSVSPYAVAIEISGEKLDARSRPSKRSWLMHCVERNKILFIAQHPLVHQDVVAAAQRLVVTRCQLGLAPAHVDQPLVEPHERSLVGGELLHVPIRNVASDGEPGLPAGKAGI